MNLKIFEKKQARKGFPPPSAMKGGDTFKILEIFWKFFGYFWNFLGIFWEFFRRIFWEEFFERNFFGGFFWEDLFGRIFLGGFF